MSDDKLGLTTEELMQICQGMMKALMDGHRIGSDAARKYAPVETEIILTVMARNDGDKMGVCITSSTLEGDMPVINVMMQQIKHIAEDAGLRVYAATGDTGGDLDEFVEAVRDGEDVIEGKKTIH